MSITITGKKNGKHLLSPEQGARSCPECGLYTHRWQDMGDISAKINQDWSVTDEGFQIVSEKFKTICKDTGVQNVDFLPLSSGSYVFRPRRVVFLDVSDALETTMGPCPSCARLTAFLGAPSEARIMPGEKRVGDIEIVRSAQTFGSDNFFPEESIFGVEIMEALNDEGLRGGVFWHDCPQEGS